MRGEGHENIKVKDRIQTNEVKKTSPEFVWVDLQVIRRWTETPDQDLFCLSGISEAKFKFRKYVNNVTLGNLPC